MHAKKLRILLFSIISLIGIFMPWIGVKKETKMMESLLVSASSDIFKVRMIISVVVVLAIILAVLGNKAKSLGIVKSVFTALFGAILLLITFKYFRDFKGQEIFVPGLGLYLMSFGGAMMIIVSIIPAQILPNSLLHKFIPAPEL